MGVYLAVAASSNQLPQRLLSMTPLNHPMVYPIEMGLAKPPLKDFTNVVITLGFTEPLSLLGEDP
jgi:hypothetical protein